MFLKKTWTYGYFALLDLVVMMKIDPWCIGFGCNDED